MKPRLFGILLAAILAIPAVTGCRATKAAGSAVERGAESVGEALKRAVDAADATGEGNRKKPALTLEEALNIALKHAGFSADQVTDLCVEYEAEHGEPKYDVEFHHGYWTHDYEIHGDTGEILSYSKDS
jgi:uncharacterized membrane protein YkoI